MKTLTKSQLAFILDIKVEDARAKMCAAYSQERNEGTETVKGAVWNMKNRVDDDFPKQMSIDLLSRRLNLPHLQTAVDDIVSNYLTRPGTRRYILRDFPDKLIKKTEEAGQQFPVKIDIPPALRSMLPDSTRQDIYNYWKGIKCNDAAQTDRFIVPKI
jgi:hypothetical protein